jgi:nucleotide-binding universal stress UspA family protein
VYKTMLVPLDRSKDAEIVLPYVEEIAAKLDAEIILVSVSESVTADTEHPLEVYLERVREQVQGKLKDWWDKKDIQVKSKVLSGKPADEILRYADESNVSLIALTSRGSSGPRPWPLGSVAAKILRATVRPVLLIRAQASELALQQKRLIKRILVPLDGSKIGEAAIPYTEALARALGAELVLFQVVEPVITWGIYEDYKSYPSPTDLESRKASAKAYLDGVGKTLEEKGLSTSSVLDYGLPARTTIDYAKAHCVDLIAMSTHGRSGITRWVFGSITDKILHAGDTAILVVQPSKV